MRSTKSSVSSALISIGSILSLLLLLVYILEREDKPILLPGNDHRNRSGEENQQETTVEDYPIKFRLGDINSRFGISKKMLLDMILQSKAYWERPAQQTLFQYDSGAVFRINLVFDERQQQRIEEQKLRNQIGETGASFNSLKHEYELELDRKEWIEKKYTGRLSEFNKKSEIHNSHVIYWNANGGAPEAIYKDLQQEERDLAQQVSGLDQEKIILSEAVTRVNELVIKLNAMIDDRNLKIAFYNGQFINAREFEKGVYNGTEINIYEYDTAEDLRATIVHELGHALGLSHTDDPNAIMHYRLERQDLRNLHLTEADLKLLRNKFPGTVLSAH